MEDKILVNLCEDHTYECNTNVIGRAGEGNITQLDIRIPDKLCGCFVYLDFEKPNGEKYKTPNLQVENSVALYEVDPYLLTDKGEIKVQIVVVTDSGATWKSSTKTYYNQYSINAEDYINNFPEKEDFLSNAQKVLDELSGEIAEITEALSNNKDFLNSVADAVEDARWVRTITGAKLKLFVGTQAEYDDLRDKTNLFAIITDDGAKNELENLLWNCSKLETEINNHSKHNFPLVASCTGAIGEGLGEIDAGQLSDGVYLAVLEYTNAEDSSIMFRYSGVGFIHSDIQSAFSVGMSSYVRISKETDTGKFKVYSDIKFSKLSFYKLGGMGFKTEMISFAITGATSETYTIPYGTDWGTFLVSEYNRDNHLYIYKENGQNRVCYIDNGNRDGFCSIYNMETNAVALAEHIIEPNAVYIASAG